MSHKNLVQLTAAECLEVGKDLMFCAIADNLEMSSHRLGSCLSTLERMQFRLATEILGQKDVLTVPQAQLELRALREQIATMEGGLAKVINKQNDWEEKFWGLREKIKSRLAGTLIDDNELAGIIGPDQATKEESSS